MDSITINITENDTNVTVTVREAGDMLKSTYDPSGKEEQVLTISDILDEDDMASDSAVKVPSQQSVKAYVDANGGGGSDSVTYATEITDASTTFDGTQKGAFNVYPFNKATAQTLTIEAGDYSQGDVINIERRGQGTLEVVQGTGVRFRGVRNTDNEYFVKDPNSMVALICRGSDVFSIVGNLQAGGAIVTISSYDSTALLKAENKVFTVTGTGFSDNMVVTITGNATLNSFTVNSSTEVELDITATGSIDDTISIVYDNGDVYTDSDVITIRQNYLYDDHPFEVGYALQKLNYSTTYGLKLRRSSDSATTDVGFDSNDKISLSSPVSVGGTLGTWIGSDNGFVDTWYNQGSVASMDVVQATTGSQPQLIASGALITDGTYTSLQFDGTDDRLETASTRNWANNYFTGFSRSQHNTDNSIVYATYTNTSVRSIIQKFRTAGGFQSLYWPVNGSGTLSLLSTATASAGTSYSAVNYNNASNHKIQATGLTEGSAASQALNTDATTFVIGDITGGSVNSLDGYLNYVVFYKSDKVSDISTIQTTLNSNL